MNNTKKKSNWKGFWIFTLALLLLFGLATAFLMHSFAGYLQEMDGKNAARENARSEKAVENYIAGLSGEYVAERLESLYAQADPALQSREEFLELVTAQLSGGVGYKVSFTSASKRTYALYLQQAEADGRHRQIGEITIEPNGKPSYGYTPWGVTGEHFDMSYLLAPGQELTVPHNYSVWVNGQQLGPEYIAQSGIGYQALAPLKSLTPAPQLPTLTAYRIPALLGAACPEIRDPAGNPAQLPEGGDWAACLPSFPEDQAQQLQATVQAFMERYVILGSNKHNREDNYEAVMAYVVAGSALAQRLDNVRGGAMWVDDFPDELLSVSFNRMVALEDGRCVCDITYVIHVVGKKDSQEETTRCQLVLVYADGVPKVESMVNYT